MSEGDEGNFETFIESKESPEITLPSEITEKFVSAIDDIVQEGSKYIKGFEDSIANIRMNLKDSNLIRKISIPDNPIDQTKIFGVDGTFKTYSAILFEYSSVGALAIGENKGDLFYEYKQLLTPPSQKLVSVLQGIMTYLELKRVNKAINEGGAELVIYDGSFISILTRINAFYGAKSKHSQDSVWVDKVNEIIENEMCKTDWFSSALSNGKTIATPKKMTSYQILKRIDPNLLKHFSDASLFSIVLLPDEYIVYKFKMNDLEDKPANLSCDKYPNLLPPDKDSILNFYNNIGFYYVYFRPYKWSHAYKIEIPGNVSESEIPRILYAVKQQIITPNIKEPFVQFFADCLSKEINVISGAIRDGLIHKLVLEELNRLHNIFSLSLGYRT